MRLLVALAAILVLATQPARGDDDPDYAYAVTFKGGLTTTRYAKPEFVERMRASRPDGVSFSWIAPPADDGGKPDADQEVEVINQAVAEVLASRPGAVLAMTSIRAKEQGLWAFYTADGPALSKALEAKLSGKTRISLKFRVGKDPEWNAVSRFVDRLSDEK